MDGCSGKRAVEGQPDSRRGNGVVLRDRINNRYRNVPICSRVSCSAGINPMKGVQVGSSDNKEKSVLSSFRSSSNGKEIVGTSCKTRSFRSSTAKSEKKLLLSQIAMDSSDSSSSSQDEAEILEVGVSLRREQRVHHRLGSGNIVHGKVKPTEAECSNLTSSTRIRRGFRQRFGLGNQDSRVGSSSNATPTNMISRHGLRNRSCNSISSDVIQSGFGPEKRLCQRTRTIRKKNSVEESSSSSSTRGKNVTEPPVEERCCGSNHGVSISHNRQARNFTSNSNNGIASVGARRSVNISNGSTRFSNGGTRRNGLLSITIPDIPQIETSTHLDSPVSLELFPGLPEVGFSGSFMSQDGFHTYSVDGIAEMLPELDRIEQDVELNYEELLAMETGLLLGGLNFYDRHRDMRLDIDDMSYEELLALEERMGTVSTALTEEAISKSLKTSVYQVTPSDDESIISSCGLKDDVKCSICQEEYTMGEEVGRLFCEHMYHVGCVKEWLRLKNWCPVCRASADPLSQQQQQQPSPSSSSSS